MNDIIALFIDSETAVVLFKLLLSLILAGIIGIERSAMNKPAGFGTFAVLGVSACLMVIGSNYYSLYYDIDAARIPAQVIAGIGFIGAGTIIRNGYSVKGITTAAGIFAVTCIGLTVGIGYYVPACIATLIIFLLISYSHYFTDSLESISNMNIIISLKKSANETEILKKIEKYFDKNNIQILSLSNNNNIKDGNTFVYIVNYKNKNISSTEILTTLISFDDILNVDVSRQ